MRRIHHAFGHKHGSMRLQVASAIVQFFQRCYPCSQLLVKVSKESLGVRIVVHRDQVDTARQSRQPARYSPSKPFKYQLPWPSKVVHQHAHEPSRLHVWVAVGLAIPPTLWDIKDITKIAGRLVLLLGCFCIARTSFSTSSTLMKRALESSTISDKSRFTVSEFIFFLVSFFLPKFDDEGQSPGIVNQFSEASCSPFLTRL
jgi:hypothetical protein